MANQSASLERALTTPRLGAEVVRTHASRLWSAGQVRGQCRLCTTIKPSPDYVRPVIRNTGPNRVQVSVMLHHLMMWFRDETWLPNPAVVVSHFCNDSRCMLHLIEEDADTNESRKCCKWVASRRMDLYLSGEYTCPHEPKCYHLALHEVLDEL